MLYDVAVYSDAAGWQTVRVALSLVEAEGIETRLSPRRVSISPTLFARPSGVDAAEWRELVAEKNAKTEVI